MAEKEEKSQTVICSIVIDEEFFVVYGSGRFIIRSQKPATGLYSEPDESTLADSNPKTN
jgi:hypothetical protein